MSALGSPSLGPLGNPQPTRQVIGGVLLHPVALTAMALWGLNDQRWKYTHPGWFTGKLSDVCGLIVAPLLCWSVLQALAALRGREPSPRWVNVCLAAPSLGFVAINVSLVASELYRRAAASVTAPLRGWLTPLGGGNLFTSGARHVADWGDLVALPALFVAWALLRAEIARRGPGGAAEGG